MQAENEETNLEGGNVTPVVRVGATVRRHMGYWSPAVHGLLRHLHEQGFEGAPRFLGIDERGREILSFMEGEVGNYPLPPYIWSDKVLVDVGRFLRRYHEATAGYTAPERARWQWTYPDPGRHEVICHNDFAPYNMVFRNSKPVGIIDFDFAGPGPRIWDLAYTAYRFVPVSYAEDVQQLGLTHPKEQARRLRLLCDAYGLEERGELLDMIDGRIQFLIDFLVNGAAAGNAACLKMVEEGHLAHYRREMEAFRERREELERFMVFDKK